MEKYTLDNLGQNHFLEMEQTIRNCIVDSFNFSFPFHIVDGILLTAFTFQGQDDFTVITMLKPQQEIQAQFTVTFS